MQALKGREKADLVARQFLALKDRNIKYENYFHQVQDGEFTTVSFDFEMMERDINKVLVA